MNEMQHSSIFSTVFFFLFFFLFALMFLLIFLEDLDINMCMKVGYLLMLPLSAVSVLLSMILSIKLIFLPNVLLQAEILTKNQMICIGQSINRMQTSMQGRAQRVPSDEGAQHLYIAPIYCFVRLDQKISMGLAPCKSLGESKLVKSCYMCVIYNSLVTRKKLDSAMNHR